MGHSPTGTGFGRPHRPSLGTILHPCLLGRDGHDVFAQFAIQHMPSLANVPVQRVGLVLNKDGDLPQPRIEAVAQGEIDDAIFPPKGDGRLGTVLRQRIEPFAFSAG